jgi:hypothetical protein
MTGVFTVKTVRKQVKPDEQPVVLESGSIEVEAVLVGSKAKIVRGNEIRIIESNGSMVTQWEIKTACEPDEPPKPQANSPDWDEIARGKVRHGVVCAYLQGGQEPNVSDVLYWTKFIMTGIAEPREEKQ